MKSLISICPKYTTNNRGHRLGLLTDHVKITSGSYTVNLYHAQEGDGTNLACRIVTCKGTS